MPAGQEAPENPLIGSWKRHMELKGSSDFGREWVSVGPVMNGAQAGEYEIRLTGERLDLRCKLKVEERVRPLD